MDRRLLPIIGLTSLTVVALEVIWTRLFSAEFFYTFAFLTLSLAIMGLGLGALVVRLFPLADRDGSLGLVLSASGLAALAGPPLVFRLGLDFSLIFSSPLMIGRFLLAVGCLSATFFFAGMGLAIVFRRHHAQMPRLYMADLVGAGLGVLAAIVTMNIVGTSAAAFVASLPVLLAAFLAARRYMKISPLVLAAGLTVLCAFAPALLESRREERGPITYRHWDAMAKLKLMDFGEARVLNIDNVANSTVIGFDGNWDRRDSEKFGFGIDVGCLIRMFPACRFVSLGAGGGQDVLQALQYGAAEVHAVEVNPHINRMMLDERLPGYTRPPAEPAPGGGPPQTQTTQPERPLSLAEFSGRIYRDPRVRVVTEDARAYVGRHKNSFDLIYSLSSNTFAALASGSFALAENYLFTQEAFQDYWESLSPGGFLTMEHQFYAPRLVASLIDALNALHVPDPTSHFAVYDLPRLKRQLILLSRRPLTDDIRNNAFGPLTKENFDDIHLLYPAPPDLFDNLINRIVANGWESVMDSATVDISPTQDDRPFVGQMGLWKNLSREGLKKVKMYEVLGFPLAKLMIVTILALAVVIVIPLNLLPYLRKGERLRAAPWLYFFTIGVAFMFVEVVLIQKYTLFVGPSVYSVAIILLTLLISSGIGSRLAPRFSDAAAFTGIVVWLLLDVFLFPNVTGSLTSLPMWGRLIVTSLLIAPLGFFMGMPFPKGAGRVGALVDWGFAVNGGASVVGATSVLLIAFNFGIAVSLLSGAAVYVAAFLLLLVRDQWQLKTGTTFGE